MLRPMWLRPGLVGVVLIVALAAHAAPALESTSTPYPGIVYERWREPAIPARVHVVRIDLTSAEIGLFATPEDDRGQTTSSYGLEIGAQVAINGDAFAVSGFRPRGLAVGNKVPWTNTADDARSAVFHFRRTADGTRERTAAQILTPELVTTMADLPPQTEGVIGGRPLLVRAGQIEGGFDCSDPVAIACQRAPRSALALSADGNLLWLVVVDGWQAGSIGMTAAELAAFLRATKNPHMAMALDGGSSATLVLDGALVSSPSDGVERTVANHLAIKFGALPRGAMSGVICRDDLIACRDDLSLRLPGAEVTLDDGRKQVVTAPQAQYNFTNITPRLACVTVRLAGYKTKTACDTVPPGNVVFESVVLEPGEDPPDAGASDGAPPIDASTGGDGTGFPDGGTGNPGMGEGGGCCDSRNGHPGMPILAGLVGFMLLRRRGTTAPR
jgi:hypothetical protein